MAIFLMSPTIPPILSSPMDSPISILSLSPIFQPNTRKRSVVLVIKPKPPTWISTKITACPNGVQKVPVSTTTRPVTHTDEVEVKSASMGDINSPVTLETDSDSKRVPIAIIAKNPYISVVIDNPPGFGLINRGRVVRQLLSLRTYLFCTPGTYTPILRLYRLIIGIKRS